MRNIKNATAAQLVEEAIRRGFTMEDVASKLQVSFNTVHRWKIGQNMPFRSHRSALEDLVAKARSEHAA